MRELEPNLGWLSSEDGVACSSPLLLCRADSIHVETACRRKSQSKCGSRSEGGVRTS